MVDLLGFCEERVVQGCSEYHSMFVVRVFKWDTVDFSVNRYTIAEYFSKKDLGIYLMSIYSHKHVPNSVEQRSFVLRSVIT